MSSNTTSHREEQQSQEPQKVKSPSKKQKQHISAQQPIPFPTDSANKEPAFPSIELPIDGKNILDELMQPEYTNEQIPYELKKQKRKRRRKRHHL